MCVAIFFRRRETVFVRAKIWEKKVWADAIDSVQKSSKSELSLRFLGRLKFAEFTRHFLVTSVDRPKIRGVLVSNSHESWDDWPNSSKSGVQNFLTSDGSKLARIVPILTILGRKRS